MRKDYLAFHVPSIGEREIDEVVDTLKSGWLTTGPRTARFEEAFKSYIGSNHAISVNSGTAALHVALAAVGIKRGDRVVVPTLTFAATAEVVCYLNAVPLLVDVNPNDFNIDPGRIESLLQSLGKDAQKVKAIIPVHFCGFPCAMDEILDIARRYRLLVIEDAAHALPTKYKGRMIGTVGDITAFSFYATKNITTGEGGMITTDNDTWAERMQTSRLHGMSRDAWKRYEAGGNWYYEVHELGFKYNLTDIAAAIGLHQLDKCDSLHVRRKAIAGMYTLHFRDMEGIDLPLSTQRCVDGDTDGYQHAWHLYPILIDHAVLRIDRGHFLNELNKRNIGVSVHFIPLHLQPYYQKRFKYRKGQFPVAEAFYERCISLPLYPSMSDQDVNDVIEAVQDIVKGFRR